jgi:hypothetical protein
MKNASSIDPGIGDLPTVGLRYIDICRIFRVGRKRVAYIRLSRQVNHEERRRTIGPEIERISGHFCRTAPEDKSIWNMEFLETSCEVVPNWRPILMNWEITEKKLNTKV